MSVRISKEKLEALFKIVKFDKRKRRWKNKTEASRLLGISRPTIDKVLGLYPEGMPKKPKKVQPKYYEDFKKTEIAKKIKAYYWDVAEGRMSKRGKTVWRVARKAFKLFQGKDPYYFDEQDYEVFWGTPTTPPYVSFVDKLTGKLAFNNASALRMIMKFSKRGDLANDPRFSTKGLQREAGRKKEWYLSEDQIARVVDAIEEVDTLLLFLLGILFGGRFSALKRLTVGNIDFQAEVVDLYEPKIRKNVEKYLPTKMVIELIALYVNDFNIKAKERLFKNTMKVYNNRLKRASEKAELPWEMTTHILKHTAITQMSLHGVDIDVIEDYVRTEARTIKSFYRGGGDKKVKAQIRGEKYEVEKWSDFIERLMPFFVDRYLKIKPLSVKVDGIKLKAKVS